VAASRWSSQECRYSREILVEAYLLCERGIHVYDYANGVARLTVTQEGLEQACVLPRQWHTGLEVPRSCCDGLFLRAPSVVMNAELSRRCCAISWLFAACRGYQSAWRIRSPAASATGTCAGARPGDALAAVCASHSLQQTNPSRGIVQAHFRMLARRSWMYLPAPPQSERLGRAFFPSASDTEKAGQGGHGTIIAMAHYGRPIMLTPRSALPDSGSDAVQAVDERNPALDAVEQSYLQFKCVIPWRRPAAAGSRPDNLRSLYQALAQGEI